MRIRGGVLAAALIVFVLPAGASAQELPDANCPGPQNDLLSFGGTTRIAQTFVAQHSGTLTAAQIEIGHASDVGDYQVEIADAPGGIPSTTSLASTSVADASLPPLTQVTLTARFASPATVAAGGQYAVIISRPGAQLDVYDRTGNPCSGALFQAVGAGSFVAFDSGTRDMIFQVFVTLSETVADAQPPETLINKGPKAKTKKRTASFEFASNETGSSFRCSLDGGPFEPCTSPKTYDHLKRKKHTFAVAATDPAGNADSTPATFDWKVKKKK